MTMIPEMLSAAMAKARNSLKAHFSRAPDGTFVFDGELPPWDDSLDSIAIACLLASVLVTNGMIRRGEINPENISDD